MIIWYTICLMGFKKEAHWFCIKLQITKFARGIEPGWGHADGKPWRIWLDASSEAIKIMW